jgi:hypothetical protein
MTYFKLGWSVIARERVIRNWQNCKIAKIAKESN